MIHLKSSVEHSTDAIDLILETPKTNQSLKVYLFRLTEIQEARQRKVSDHNSRVGGEVGTYR